MIEFDCSKWGASNPDNYHQVHNVGPEISYNN